MAYDHRDIEKKAQEKWASLDLYRADLSDESKEPYYLLVEFPYPSGDLHIGHWYAFAVTDIYARLLRMRGKNVLFPIGFDAFGLPAERAAIKHGVDPKEWTYKNIERMRTQLRSMGSSFDWSKEVVACDPSYYQWTQWLFAKLFEHNLAEHREAAVKWCPTDMTVLANEQVIDGRCERCGTEVEEKRLTQWFLKITDYAERLLAGLETLPWRNEIKDAQRAWIGKSEGAYLDFALAESKVPSEIVFASSNQGKLKRMQNLIKAAGLVVTLRTPQEVGIEGFDVEEDGKTLAENSEKKALALAALTDLPVLADDSGFFIDNEEIDPVTVKRNALAGVDEKALTVEEIALRMQKYYADIAAKRGGRIDAEWRNNLCFVTAGKVVRHEETVRPVILTSESHGTVDPYMPLRGLYISKATNKYVLEQTDEEELLELKPITDGFRRLFVSPSVSAVRVFTTRPDTVFGATYVVLAPEHSLIQNNELGITNYGEIQEYIKKTAQKTERERSENKEKTGVKLEGVSAVNPATKEEIPVYAADYVLASYGTGAVMAVPAHDERDFEFAQKFSLPIRQVVVQRYVQTTEPGTYRPSESVFEKQGIIAVIKHWSEEKYLGLKWKQVDWGTFLTGGVDEGMTPEETVLKEIREETGFTHAEITRKLGFVDGLFYHVPKGKNQLVHAHIFEVKLRDGEKEPVSADEEAKHDLVWLTSEELRAFLTPETHQYSLRLLLNGFTPNTDAGSLVNSGEFTGKNSEEAKWDIVAAAGGARATQYRLRDWLVSRQRYWGCPIPIVYDPEGKPHAIPAEHLPWLLPTDVDFTPTGKAPLATSKELQERVTKIFGEGWTPEYDTLDTFVDSSWYFLRYLDSQDAHDFSDAALMKKWLPINRYSGGSEHTTMHVLYARFFMKALYDLALVPVDEPFYERFNRGLIMGPDGQKMSKSKGNVVNPDEFVQKYGADAVRVYLAFIGPYNEPGSYPWNLDGVASMRKFLDRITRLVDKHLEAGPPSAGMPEAVGQMLARASAKVALDGDRFKFNTGVAALMILVNELEAAPSVPQAALMQLAVMLAPFAPHLAEHLWTQLEGEGSVHQQSWPAAELAAAAEKEVTVQVNGKRRGSVALATDAPEADAVAGALKIPAVAAALGGKEPKRVVYVAGRILNLVV